MKIATFWLSVFYIALLSCSKDPGVGGKAIIKGKVHLTEFNDNTCQEEADYYVAEQRVYIVYGDHEFHDDDVRTGPNGQFEFRWLRKGDYRVFVYSECPTSGCPDPCVSGIEAIFQNVSIDNNKEEVELNDFEIESW